ncbi:hypothetical protein F511_14687 [Dorcoceras hygrometricum]|uniref:RING-type domain-containing protein n=1 Tax=Dorcoceras hygrometricum TaxID=472368 RepID=A0A2Z7BRP5_9LAMI|nr:hypothetical protein F511_14687 [Dorcoceras hygrometricum]
MGFLFHAIKIKLPALFTSLDILTHLRFLFTIALTRLGIYKPPPEQQQEDPNSRENNYIFILDGSSPSLVPIPVHTVTAAIKKKVPIIQYRDCAQRLGEMGSDSDQMVCTVCLECVGLSDEIRELSNCSHVFHRDCLDAWVDEGQVTCPMCRSILLPRPPNSKYAFRIM